MIKEYETLIFEKRDDGIAIVTLNRPKVLNSLSEAMFVELVKVWDQVNEDKQIRVAILTAAGDRAFCAGKDIKEYVAKTEAGVHGVDDPNNPAYAAPGNHYPVYKPVIGAINGLAIAGGLELFFMADMRVMAEGAWIGTWAQRVNLAPPPYLYAYLPNAIASWVQFTAGRLDAQACLRWGIVNEVVPLKDLMPTALKYAQQVLEIDKLGPDAIAETKRGHIEFQKEHHIVYDTREAAERAKGQFHRRGTRVMEGQKSFLRRSKPDYKGMENDPVSLRKP